MDPNDYHQYSEWYPPAENDVEGNAVAEVLSQEFSAFASTTGTAIFQAPLYTAPGPYYPLPPDNLPLPSTSHAPPPSLDGSGGDEVANFLHNYFQYTFAGENTGVVPSLEPDLSLSSSNAPAPPPQPTADTLQQHELAMSFIAGKAIPFLLSLNFVGADAWYRLCGHLTLVAWRYLAQDHLEPRSESFWEAQISRVYLDYTQRGVVFTRVAVSVDDPRDKKVIIETSTCIAEAPFVNKIVNYLRKDTVRDFVSHFAWSSRQTVESCLDIHVDPTVRDAARSWMTWRGVDEGFPLFHEYLAGSSVGTHKPLFFKNQQLLRFLRVGLQRMDGVGFLGICEETTGVDGHYYFRTTQSLDLPFVEFLSGSYVTTLEFLLNRPNRRADVKWKSDTLSNLKYISPFFRRIFGCRIVGVSQAEGDDIRNSLISFSTTSL